MITKMTDEITFSTTYVQNYLDCVENLPDDLQRQITRLRELDVVYQGLLKEVEQQQASFQNEKQSVAKRKGFLVRVQQALISAQEIGDERLQIAQQVQDLIENRTKQLDICYKKLVQIDKNQDENDASKENHMNNREILSIVNNNIGNSNGERQLKRSRRTRADAGLGSDLSAGSEVLSVPETEQLPYLQGSLAGSNQKKGITGAAGKKKKRKSRQNNQQQNQNRDVSPNRDDEILIDPDEPTYCLCDQISYGEMIMCDNDLCPYEWFHFSCVSLGAKPKGKWYCPKCRGDRSCIMKPKAQFLKELEKYNREKEQKENGGFN